jgi:anti-anti-sigma factor
MHVKVQHDNNIYLQEKNMAELGSIMKSKEANIDRVGEHQYVLRFNQDRFIDAGDIQNLGDFMFQFADGPKGHGEKRKLVIDFGGLDFLAAAALNKVIYLNTKLKTRGDELVFANIKPEIKEVFVITKLTKIFNIKDTVEEALQSEGVARSA